MTTSSSLPIPDGSTHHPDIEPLEEYDESLLFDWKTISARCISPAPHHPAYGMNVAQYIKARSDFLTQEDQMSKMQIHFRMPPEVLIGIPKLAHSHSLSPTRYMGVLLELGLIHFTKDYHDTISSINAERDALFMKSTNDFKMIQILKQTICLHTSSRKNDKFSPVVPEWMGGAIKSSAFELNCCQSDLACLCICIGIRIDSTVVNLPEYYKRNVESTITIFENELYELKRRINMLNTL